MKRQTPPIWFRTEPYEAAASMDAGDWLLNLALRCWLHNYANPQTEEALRMVGPVLRRADSSQLMAMHKADRHRWVERFSSDAWDDPFAALYEACARPMLPSDVWHALLHGAVRNGINPLKVAELYAFERMLPGDVRAAGVRFKPGDAASIYPRAFGGTLDDAFGTEPENQPTGRFVRIDLTLPDDVLLADLQRFLKAERLRLAAMGGQQPYREAARLKLRAHQLEALAADGLLQFLDLDRWQRAEGLGLTVHAVREMAGIERERETSLRRRAKEASNQMVLHAWFARLKRSAALRPPRRKGPQ